MRDDCKHCIGDAHAVYRETYPDATHCMFCGRYIGKNDYHASEASVIEECDAIWGGDTEERHPAYAQLNITRQSGGINNLYGSAIKHQETICLEIKRSVKHTSQYSERYYGENVPLISIRMSQSQFAEAITSMNMGSGVPVTLESIRNQVMPKCQEVTVSEKANSDLRKNMNKFADKVSDGMNRVNEILNKKGSILKGERKEIAALYTRFMQDLRSNMPFLHECMTEAYDKTAQSAKADIEAFHINAITRMGLEAMRNKDDAIEFIDFETTPDGRERGTEVEFLEGE